MHLGLLIQDDTGTPSIVHSIHPSTPKTGVILMFITKSHQADTLFRGKGRQKHCPPKNPRNTLTEFKDVFGGSFPGMHKIQLKPDIEVIEPVIHPPRKIPKALQDKLERELKSMEEVQVIVKVTGPTDWVNSIATPEKQRTGALRVCLDPRDLNRAVQCEHYPFPTLEDLTLLLSGAKYFSVLDATPGYWQIKLDE